MVSVIIISKMTEPYPSGCQATVNASLEQRDYSDVIMAMRNLHPNKREDGRNWLDNNEEKFLRSMGFFFQAGLSLDDLNNLGVIHVAGTKGKGSTCAMTESILRQRGLKTALFTSPHMVSFRERIRVNGNPISQETFVHHFWHVYNRIVARNAPYDRPGYFQFLTVLAFKIFLHEKVDVAIIEGKLFFKIFLLKNHEHY